MSKQMWENYGSGYKVVAAGAERLPAGVYYLYTSAAGTIYEPLKQNHDAVFNLPGSPNDFIIEQINKFWASRHIYEQYKFVHKRGILLYGSPGNGKTSIIAALIKNIVEQDGVVINVRQFSLAAPAIKALKKTEPERKVMTLIEDMDTLLAGDYKTEEPYALSMLDGQDSCNGIVHVGTTNFPEQLADRFIKRPGRFDLVIGVGNPTKEARRVYFQKVLNNENHPELDYLVDRTEGLSLAYLRELAASYLCLGIPVEESVARLKKNFTNSVRVTKTSHSGFKVGYDPLDDEVGCATSK